MRETYNDPYYANGFEWLYNKIKHKKLFGKRLKQFCP